MPDELADMLRVVREAPASWFRSRRRRSCSGWTESEPLLRLMDIAKTRALTGLATPTLTAAVIDIEGGAGHKPSGHAPGAGAGAAHRHAAGAGPEGPGRLHLAGPADAGPRRWCRSATWPMAATAAPMWPRPRPRSWKTSAASSPACMPSFSGTPAVLRLEWAQTLSEFDAAPNLRNLASLPRWSEIAFVDRTAHAGLCGLAVQPDRGPGMPTRCR